MTLVPINPRSRPAELEHALRLSGAVCLFAAEDVGGNPVADLAAEAAGRLPALQEVRRCVGGWRDVARAAEPSALPVVDPESLAQVQFTSGTTGRAKGVQITHAGMVVTGRAFADRLGPSAGRVWVNPMPLFHTAGNVLGVVGALWARAEHVVLPFAPAPCSARWPSAGRPCSRPPHVAGPARGPPRPPGLRPDRSAGALHRGMTVTPAFVDRVESVFGARLSITFGMTETCGAVLQTAPTDPTGSAGRPSARRWREPTCGSPARTARRCPPAWRGSSGCGAPGSRAATSTTPTRRRRPSTPTAGCTPVTWRRWTPPAPAGWSAGSRT